jgi:hypothetical protein
VTRYKASRDKLLLELDRQWDEIERLSTENAALSEDARAARVLAANWERQAQDGLSQVRLPSVAGPCCLLRAARQLATRAVACPGGRKRLALRSALGAGPAA